MHKSPYRKAGSQPVAEDKYIEKKIRENCKDLYQAKEKLDFLLKTIPDPMDIVDENLNILWASDRMKKMFKQEIVGKKCYQAYRDDKAQCKDCPLKKPLRIGEGKTFVSDRTLGGRTFEITHTAMMYEGKKAILEVFRDVTEQNRFREALKKSEAQYRDIVENSPEMIHSIDSKGVIFFVNSKECEMLGYKRDELVGQSMEKIYPPSLIQEVKRGFDQLKKQKFLNIPHTQLIAKNGSLIEVEMHSIALFDSHDRIHSHFVRTRSISLDITERTKAEEALRLSEEKYRDIVENSPEMIHSVDANGMISFVNKKECELLGYRSQELIGKPMRIVYSPNLIKEVEAGFEKLKKIGSLTIPESQMVKKNGEPLEVEVHSIGLYDKAGKFIQTRSIIIDITDQKRARLELQKYKLGIESSSQAIFTTDRQGVITYVNPAFTTTYGYTKKEALGKTPHFLKSGTHPLSFYRHFWKILISGNSIHFELINKTKDGRLIHVSAAVNPILDDKKSIVGFLAIQTDITQQKMNEQALSESENRYRTLVESLPACIKLFDTKGRLLSINRFGKEEHDLTRMSDKQIKNWDYFKSIEAEDHDKLRKAMAKALKGEISSLVIHHTHTHAKGGYCFSTVVPIMEAGKVTHIILSSTDITAQKINEEELQKKVGQMEFMGRVNIKRYKKMLQMEREIDELKRRLGEDNSKLNQKLET